MSTKKITYKLSNYSMEFFYGILFEYEAGNNGNYVNIGSASSKKEADSLYCEIK